MEPRTRLRAVIPFTNIVYLGEGFHRRPAQCVQRTKTGGQDLGRLLSHLSDTKGEQETGKVVLLERSIAWIRFSADFGPIRPIWQLHRSAGCKVKPRSPTDRRLPDSPPRPVPALQYPWHP